jgi:hypothetical protein
LDTAAARIRQRSAKWAKSIHLGISTVERSEIDCRFVSRSARIYIPQPQEVVHTRPSAARFENLSRKDRGPAWCLATQSNDLPRSRGEEQDDCPHSPSRDGWVGERSATTCVTRPSGPIFVVIGSSECSEGQREKIANPALGTFLAVPFLLSPARDQRGVKNRLGSTNRGEPIHATFQLGECSATMGQPKAHDHLSFAVATVLIWGRVCQAVQANRP